MDFKPLLYFCSLIDNDNSETSPIFADFEESVNLPFSSAYQIRYREIKKSLIKTIWYDFARERYIYNEIDLQHLEMFKDEESYLDLLYISDYGLLVWNVNKDVSSFIYNKDGLFIDNFTKIDARKEWFKKKNYLQKKYNDNRNEIEYKLQLWKNYIISFTKQYCYRYSILYGKLNSKEKVWSSYEDNKNIPQYCNVEQLLFDGTHNKLHDSDLLKYHEAGKPKKLAIKWHIKKSEYTVYFWFEDEKICSIFERFYGAHPDTKTDFIIRIDAEQRKYELALFRQGLKEPQIIPEDAYQLLVFKNKFEDYRSDNYNQERGAWIW